MDERDSPHGSLLSIPFGQSETETTVRESYRDLYDEFGAEDVLVLTGSPTSTDTFRRKLADEVSGAGVPRVSSLVVHATDVVNMVTEKSILSDAVRRELIHRFLAHVEWEIDYFQQASSLDSFTGDVAQLIETATWHGTELDQTPSLIELQRVSDDFHDWIAGDGYIERSQLLTTAYDCLTDPDNRDDVVDFEAVLAVEFEEAYPLDRRYLDTLTTDLELVCIGERDSSVRRTGVETGSITDRVSFATESVDEPASPTSRPEATAQYLASGMIPDDPGSGSVSVLHAESADEQADLVADEIERLRSERGWGYDAFAVAVKRGGSAVSETIKALTQAGTPCSSATVTGFGDDPAVRALLDVTRQFEAMTSGSGDLDGKDRPADPDLLAAIEADEDSMADALRRWATASGLKERIAEREPALEARSQLGNVRQAFAIVEFIEDTGLLDGSWQIVLEALERAHEYASTQAQTSAIDLDAGVRVDHPQALKNGSWRAVFILDAIDQEYPGDQFLTRLFPLERALDMPDFPRVTDVSRSQVRDTFQTISTTSSRPIRQYHVELSRRRMAVAANAAADQLYFCLYDHADSSLDERVQPSRYLTDAYRQLPWIDAGDDETIWSERRAEEFALARIERALADVRRTQSRDVTIALDDVAADLAAIQDLLTESGGRGGKIREAVQARVDFAAGRVRRE